MASRIRQIADTDTGGDTAPDVLVSARQIAERLGVSRSTVYRWIERTNDPVFPPPAAVRRAGRADRGPQWWLAEVRGWWSLTAQERVGGWRPADLESDPEYRCPGCGEVKPREAYYQQRRGREAEPRRGYYRRPRSGGRGRNGISQYCKDCEREKRRERAAKSKANGFRVRGGRLTYVPELHRGRRCADCGRELLTTPDDGLCGKCSYARARGA